MSDMLIRVSLLSLALTWGCTTDPGAEDAETLDVTVEGDDGVLTFEIRSEEPLVEGTNDLRIRVLRERAPFTGSVIRATVHMASMTHGGSSPTSSSLGDGEFILHDVQLDMPGEWQLDVYAENAEPLKLRDTVTVHLEVP